MSVLDDETDPELYIYKHDNDDEEEEIEEMEYKSASLDGIDSESAIEVLKKHGGSMRKLYWLSNGVISTSNLLDLLNVLPRLEEIKLESRDGFKFDKNTSELDLSRITSLHCNSDECLSFFSSLMPANCLNEFSMAYGSDQQVTKFRVDHFEMFIQHQTSIRAFSISSKIPLSGLNVLTLEKLILGKNVETLDVVEALENQSELKMFHYGNQIDLKALEEVCKCVKLESLKLRVVEIKCGKILENLKNLKQLHINFVMEGHHQKTFFSFSMDSLEVLTLGNRAHIDIPEILEQLAINFPNLTTLRLSTTQKVNYIAKLFPNLEDLEINLFCPLWEVDTGIVHEKLRNLKFECPDIFLNFCELSEIFFELFKIFPNMESLDFDTIEECSKTHCHFANSNLFEDLIKLENLKEIALSTLELNLDKTSLVKTVKDLRKVAEKFEEVFLRFNFSTFRKLEANEAEFCSLKSTFDWFMDELKETYTVSDIVSNYDDCVIDGHFYFTFSIEKE